MRVMSIERRELLRESIERVWQRGADFSDPRLLRAPCLPGILRFSFVLPLQLYVIYTHIYANRRDARSRYICLNFDEDAPVKV